MISHDRALLNEVCDGILDFDYGKIQYYEGNYEAYKEQKQAYQQRLKEDAERYERKKKKMEERMAYLKQKSKNPGFATLLRVQEAKFKREFS
jgi:macrolide transport system ATP-binding/permease protein